MQGLVWLAGTRQEGFYTMAVAAIPTYIPLKEAAQRLSVSVKVARSMLKSGKIQGGILPDGEMIVIADSVPAEKKIRKEELPAYRKFVHLNGIKIGVGEASRKYEIPVSTLHRWAVQKKLITVLAREGQKVLLDEQDVAYCAETYHRNKGQGKWIFDENGVPYKLRTQPLAG